ncbi:hypothetical protein [Chryseobacterium flavum]|uniref:hypothetical protein n=1 Tax=Chryseobacterium flavum TaxID=415851 RepID=UPI0028A85FD5|nr:hypothetical protein [Chryseobacterium flavum]
MRKLILLCSIAFFFSCSNENEYHEQLNSADQITVNKNETGRGIDSDFDNSFYNHENSPTFIEFNTKTKAFVSKMKFNGNIETIKTKDAMLSWISAHLSATDFSSMNEATQQWAQVENLCRINMNTHMVFFEKIPANRLRFAELVLYESVKDIITNNTTCKDELNACNSDSVDEYTGAMQGALEDYFSGSASSTTTNNRMANARVIYQINLNLCMDQYENCLLR